MCVREGTLATIQNLSLRLAHNIISILLCDITAQNTQTSPSKAEECIHKIVKDEQNHKKSACAIIVHIEIRLFLFISYLFSFFVLLAVHFVFGAFVCAFAVLRWMFSKTYRRFARFSHYWAECSSILIYSSFLRGSIFLSVSSVRCIHNTLILFQAFSFSRSLFIYFVHFLRNARAGKRTYIEEGKILQ